ncbi:MAG: hypothetical protein Q8Q89_02935 [bacterium]|nr:hypothetical protein [bacterium]
MRILPGKELLKKIGLWVASVLGTYVLFIFLIFVLQYFNLNENVAIGIPEILVFYFWGGYFLRKHRWPKALGIVLFIIAIAFNFVFISSPYNTVNEFKATRVFLLPSLLASIFLILQQSKPLRLLGILVIILTILGAFWAAIFLRAGLGN